MLLSKNILAKKLKQKCSKLTTFVTKFLLIMLIVIIDTINSEETFKNS